jgi:hypothetical protein
MPHHLEVGVVGKVGDIVLSAGEVVVDAKDIVTLLEQQLAQMRTEKACAAGYEDTISTKTHQALLRDIRLILLLEAGIGFRSTNLR